LEKIFKTGGNYMKQKKNSSLEQHQTCRKAKSIKVLYSNSHTDRPKISMEGKWLEQIGFHIGDRLQVSYGDRFIFISHSADGSQPLAVHEPISDIYMAGTADFPDMGQTCEWQNREDIKNKQIKVTSSIHVRQTIRRGGSFYYPKRSKISMEGKWLEKAGFRTGNRLRVEYWENAICIYPAA